jgi:hypothetical protein
VPPAKPKIGLRTTRANEMWHIDTSVICLLDGARAYLRAVIDTPVNSVSVLLHASRAAAPSDATPVVLADAGVENEPENSRTAARPFEPGKHDTSARKLRTSLLHRI